MIKEVNIFGIYVAPFAAYLFWSLLIFVPLRMGLDRIEAHRWFWHRRLLEVAIFLIILSLVGLHY